MIATPAEFLDLLDWKRRISELYAYVRDAEPREGWRAWRDERDYLFKTHPQSPLSQQQRGGFEALDFYDYDPAARVFGEMVPCAEQELRLPVSRHEEIAARRVARVSFRLYEEDAMLDLFWITGYGGGLFLPFRDATGANTTYGAGRYLYDTIKGADLGTRDGKLILDFNFAYNPSCAYDPSWACPLAPPGNLLEVPVEAGEQKPTWGP